MYGVVLMAAMTAGSATPDCTWGSHGCNGCYGSFGGHNYAGCYGWYGGCHGCWGGCYGGWGGNGGFGCYGGSSGYGCYGGYGCAGCYGGWSCYGSGYGGCYGGYQQPITVVPTDKVPVEKLPKPKDDKEQTSRAKVVIDVPAQAKLYIDDQLMPEKAGKRTFVTPVLKAGQTYYYDVKIVVTREGQEQAQTTRVLLQAGEVVAATFAPAANNNGTATAQVKRD
jgi:uncharacterized protein (TIGR03000 family)